MRAQLNKLRRFYQRARARALKAAERARERRQAALKRGDREGAQSALRVIRRQRAKAQELLTKRRAVRRKLRLLQKSAHTQPTNDQVGLTWLDGKQVAAWIAHDLQIARENGWRGYVVSGYRSPEYSDWLCKQMCGRPSCPGRCAGRISNHSGINYPHGAVDVTDYINLKHIAARHGLRIRNSLPRTDPVHFSASGY